MRRRESVGGPAFGFLAGVARATPKVTMPSPPTFHFWRGRDTFAPGTYDDPAEYFSDLAKVYREELADLAARGARYVQLDDVPLVMLCDPDIRGRLARDGEDVDALIDLYLASTNDALADRPTNSALTASRSARSTPQATTAGSDPTRDGSPVRTCARRSTWAANSSIGKRKASCPDSATAPGSPASASA